MTTSNIKYIVGYFPCQGVNFWPERKVYYFVVCVCDHEKRERDKAREREKESERNPVMDQCFTEQKIYITNQLNIM